MLSDQSTRSRRHGGGSSVTLLPPRQSSCILKLGCCNIKLDQIYSNLKKLGGRLYAYKMPQVMPCATRCLGWWNVHSSHCIEQYPSKSMVIPRFLFLFLIIFMYMVCSSSAGCMHLYTVIVVKMFGNTWQYHFVRGSSESTHFVVVVSSGSGKIQILTPLQTAKGTPPTIFGTNARRIHGLGAKTNAAEVRKSGRWLRHVWTQCQLLTFLKSQNDSGCSGDSTTVSLFFGVCFHLPKFSRNFWVLLFVVVYWSDLPPLTSLQNVLCTDM